MANCGSFSGLVVVTARVPPSDSVPSAPKALPAAPSSSGSMWSGQCGVLYTTALQFVHSGPVPGLLVATARFAMT